MNKYLKVERFFDELIINIKMNILENTYDYKRIKRILKKLIKLNNIKNDDIFCDFLDNLITIIEDLRLDLIFFYESDPAAKDLKEIVLAYPGFYAIVVYRIANLLTKYNVEYLPKLLSEYAHSKTGIDIHPKAEIGKYFFIDHGTGVVIGETTNIGHHVKLYHNVTLGALSLKEGQKLKGLKRHPTVGNYVTIYAGACILGGNTIIDSNVVISSNAFITTSVHDKN